MSLAVVDGDDGDGDVNDHVNVNEISPDRI